MGFVLSHQLNMLPVKVKIFLNVLRMEVKISPVLGTFILRLQDGLANVLLWFPESFLGGFINVLRGN
jgi:hypothetical protein